jgi:competence protein ComEC
LTFTEKSRTHPQANSDYLLYCKVIKTKGKTLQLQQAEHTEWKRIPYTYTLAEKRFWAKKWVNDTIKSLFRSPPVQSFLSGIVTGDFDDRALFDSFKELGLLHLLAISGFHFNILAALLSALLGLLLPEKYRPHALVLCLSTYFLFLGLGPSVLRAWMTILLFYSAAFASRFSDPINSLGAGLLFSLLIDPYLFMNIGFQFSFATTAAILYLNKPTSALLDRFFPKHTYNDVIRYPISSQHAYLLLRFTLSSLSLTIATSLTAFPLSLLLFGSFPLLSMAYNLFFPFLVTVSVSLLMAGLIVTPLYPLSMMIHRFNDYFTSFILNLTYFD